MTARQAHLAAALTLTAAMLAGCNVAGGPTATAPTPSATPEPREALLAAVPDDKDGAYKFSIKGGDTPVSGVVDPGRKAMVVDVEENDADSGLALAMTTLVVGDDTWMKITFEPANLPGLPKLPKKWLKLDDGKLGGTEVAGEVADPGSMGPIVANAADVKEQSPGKYAGTADLSGSQDAEIISPEGLKALGDKAKAVPFTAVVNDAGLLTTLTLKIPAAGKSRAYSYSISYSGFGRTETPAKPSASEQTPAPDVVYELVNG